LDAVALSLKLLLSARFTFKLSYNNITCDIIVANNSFRLQVSLIC